MSSTEIGELLDLSHNTILKHLHKCNIDVRNLSESQWNFNKKEFPEDLKNKDKLYDLYIT